MDATVLQFDDESADKFLWDDLMSEQVEITPEFVRENYNAVARLMNVNDRNQVWNAMNRGGGGGHARIMDDKELRSMCVGDIVYMADEVYVAGRMGFTRKPELLQAVKRVIVDDDPDTELVEGN